MYAPAKTILTQVKLGFLQLITPKASEDGGTPKTKLVEKRDPEGMIRADNQNVLRV
jgi:hypothetical protein